MGPEEDIAHRRKRSCRRTEGPREKPLAPLKHPDLHKVGLQRNTGVDDPENKEQRSQIPQDLLSREDRTNLHGITTTTRPLVIHHIPRSVGALTDLPWPSPPRPPRLPSLPGNPRPTPIGQRQTPEGVSKPQPAPYDDNRRKAPSR